MTNQQIIQQLEIIRNKGCCYHTIHKANRALGLIRPHITEQEYMSIHLGIVHFCTCGEGPDELFDSVKKLKEKYENNEAIDALSARIKAM